MDPVTGLITGAASGIIGGGLSFLGGQSTNQANAQLASNQDAFQEQMSNTAYQRSAADMKAAGLNPMMMMASGGGPASAPSGATIPMQNPVPSDVGSKVVGSAFDSYKTAQDVAKSNADMAKTSSDINLNASTQKLQSAQARSALASAGMTKAQTDKTLAEMPASRVEGQTSDMISGVIQRLKDFVGSGPTSANDSVWKPSKFKYEPHDFTPKSDSGSWNLPYGAFIDSQ